MYANDHEEISGLGTGAIPDAFDIEAEPGESYLSSPEIEQAIREAHCYGKEQPIHRQCFELARSLKALPCLKNVPPGEMTAILQRWQETGADTLKNEAFEVLMVEFASAYCRIKTPRGQSTMKEAFEVSQTLPLPECAEQFQGAQTKLLVGLVAQLQEMRGKKPFPLPCEAVGELLGVNHQRASVLIRALVFFGVLAETGQSSHRKGKAKEYRYTPSLPPV